MGVGKCLNHGIDTDNDYVSIYFVAFASPPDCIQTAQYTGRGDAVDRPHSAQTVFVMVALCRLIGRPYIFSCCFFLLFYGRPMK